MDKTKMDEAWAKFDKAVSFEAKAGEKSKRGEDKSENMQRMALRAADKNLDEAVALEAEALTG